MKNLNILLYQAWKLLMIGLVAEAHIKPVASSQCITSRVIDDNANLYFTFMRQCPLHETALIAPCQFRASENARKFYSISDTTFEEDKQATTDMIHELSSTDKIFRCKKQMVFSSTHKIPNTILFGTDDDLNRPTTMMQYAPHTKTITIRTGIAQSLSLFSHKMKLTHQRILSEEIHHATQSARNRELRKNYQPDFDNALIVPFTSPQEIAQLTDALTKGLLRVRKLIQIGLTQSNSHEEYNELRKIAKHYEPFIHRMVYNKTEISLLQAWINKGYIDKNLRVKKPFTHPIKIDTDISTNMHVMHIADGHIYFNLGTDLEKQPELTALLDFYGDVNVQLLKLKFNDPDIILNQSAEIDAHIYRYFQMYPALLNFLFPGVEQYHQQRLGKNYRDCLEEDDRPFHRLKI